MTIFTHLSTRNNEGLQSPCFTKDELTRRGWFDSTIDELLPFYERISPNFQNPLLEPMVHYRQDRVLKLEADPLFAQLNGAILEKASTNILNFGTQHYKLLDFASYEISLNRVCLTQDELEKRLLVEASIRLPNTSILDLPIGIWQKLAVIVQMQEFEPQVWQLEPFFFHPSYREAKNVVLHRFLDSIYSEHDELESACHNFAREHCFSFNPNGFDCTE